MLKSYPLGQGGCYRFLNMELEKNRRYFGCALVVGALHSLNKGSMLRPVPSEEKIPVFQSEDWD